MHSDNTLQIGPSDAPHLFCLPESAAVPNSSLPAKRPTGFSSIAATFVATTSRHFPQPAPLPATKLLLATVHRRDAATSAPSSSIPPLSLAPRTRRSKAVAIQSPLQLSKLPKSPPDTHELPWRALHFHAYSPLPGSYILPCSDASIEADHHGIPAILPSRVLRGSLGIGPQQRTSVLQAMSSPGHSSHSSEEQKQRP